MDGGRDQKDVDGKCMGVGWGQSTVDQYTELTNTKSLVSQHKNLRVLVR